jgi:hypothetical protein
VPGVSFLPAARWLVLLVLLLLATLGWKLSVRPADLAEIQEQEKAAQHRIADFLVRHNFVVAASERMHEGRPTIRASAGECRLLIARSPALAWDRDVIRRQATASDRVFIVFRGRVYAEQPTWLTVTDKLWSRVRRELGFGGQETPVFAVIATASCNAERLPWDQIR